jgi:hypothetical protein
LLSSEHKTNILGSYWKIIVSLRWTLTLLILVFARDHFYIQILSLLGLSILNQTLLLSSKPLREPMDQRMALFNEIATSIYLYTLMLLTEFMGEIGSREQIGWALMILIGAVVLINLAKVVLIAIPPKVKRLNLRIKKICKRKETVPIKPKSSKANAPRFFEDPHTVDNSLITNNATSFENYFSQEPSLDSFAKKSVIKI